MLLVAPCALAFTPADPTLTGLTEHEGQRVVDTELLRTTYRDLVAELGTAIAPQPLPTATTGAYGFEIGLSSRLVLVDARNRADRVGPWDRSVADEDHGPFLAMPTITARKGLPGSLEVGGQLGWIAGSRTGHAGAWGRVALIENYGPLPDLTLHAGYAGYVGNDQLDVAVFDAGVSIGGRVGIGQGGENNGRFEPFASFSMLRVSAAPTVDPAVAAQVGAQPFRRNLPEAQLPIALPRVGGGFQITSGVVHFRVAGSWSWQTLPAFEGGMGLSF